MAIESATLPKLLHDDVPEAPFYIPATGPAMRPRFVLKHDDTFVVLDSAQTSGFPDVVLGDFNHDGIVDTKDVDVIALGAVKLKGGEIR